MEIVIGSRGSRLALWQANWVKNRLESLGYKTDIVIIKTSGDRLFGASLLDSGTRGLFIKEIEEALQAGHINLAVHSLKDLPTEQPEGLSVVAVPKREDSHDVLVSRDGEQLHALPPRARIGTGSLRRQSQVRALRPDLKFIPLRGNVDTRLRKLDAGECDALVLAAAGLERLGFSSRITHRFSADEVCPAVGQGALALEARTQDAEFVSAVQKLDHPPTHHAVRAERAMLQALGGGCQLPIGAHTVASGEELHLTGVVANPSGTTLLRAASSGPINDPEALGRSVAEELLKQGARRLLDTLNLHAG